MNWSLLIEVAIYGLALVGCGWFLGRDSAYKEGVKQGANSTIDTLIDQGYLKATKLGNDVELHKLDK